MDKKLFSTLKSKHIKITLKPNAFRLDGIVEELFDDCFQFKTTKQTSYIEYDAIMSVILLE